MELSAETLIKVPSVVAALQDTMETEETANQEETTATINLAATANNASQSKNLLTLRVAHAQLVSSVTTELPAWISMNVIR